MLVILYGPGGTHTSHIVSLMGKTACLIVVYKAVSVKNQLFVFYYWMEVF